MPNTESRIDGAQSTFECCLTPKQIKDILAESPLTIQVSTNLSVARIMFTRFYPNTGAFEITTRHWCFGKSLRSLVCYWSLHTYLFPVLVNLEHLSNTWRLQEAQVINWCCCPSISTHCCDQISNDDHATRWESRQSTSRWCWHVNKIVYSFFMFSGRWASLHSSSWVFLWAHPWWCPSEGFVSNPRTTIFMQSSIVTRR